MNVHHTPSTSSSRFPAVRTGVLGLALAAATVTLLAGCDIGVTGGGTAAAPGGSGGTGDAPEASVAPEAPAASANEESDAPAATGSPKAKTPKAPKTSATTWHSATPPAPSGPRVVSFKLTKKPKCPEGTAVFRSENVPAVITWKITGATSAALSVDNPGLVGSYGTYEIEGSETFQFSCGGPVGSTETHTYTIYTVGGGEQHSKTLKVSAKIIDDGKKS
jgi:hypothetical protein